MESVVDLSWPACLPATLLHHLAVSAPLYTVLFHPIVNGRRMVFAPSFVVLEVETNHVINQGAAPRLTPESGGSSSQGGGGRLTI